MTCDNFRLQADMEPVEFGTIELRKKGKGFFKTQDINSDAAISGESLATLADGFATVSDFNDDVVGCCFLELFEPEEEDEEEV